MYFVLASCARYCSKHPGCTHLPEEVRVVLGLIAKPMFVVKDQSLEFTVALTILLGL